MKIIATIWISVLLTFALTSAYLLLNEKQINAPGELGESIAAIGIVLFVVLILVSFGMSAIMSLKNKRSESE